MVMKYHSWLQRARLHHSSAAAGGDMWLWSQEFCIGGWFSIKAGRVVYGLQAVTAPIQRTDARHSKDLADLSPARPTGVPVGDGLWESERFGIAQCRADPSTG